MLRGTLAVSLALTLRSAAIIMPTHSDDTALQFVQTSFGDKQASKLDSIQTLWSGYGEIARYFVPSLAQSVIVKLVQPPSQMNHPRSWNGARSHQRKLDSYVNESIFYQHYSQQTDHHCRTPSCYFSSTNPSTTLSASESAASALIMEDLDQAGFSKRCDYADLKTVKLGLRWLAYFHAKFLNQGLDDVWPIGTYWHLATRPDEFDSMPDSRLKQNAQRIDEALNSAHFQTLLHGDAKLANFCFSEKLNDLAAVDFQYVGRGVGIKDVMYFLGSCLGDDALALHADAFLDDYFSLLEQAIEHYYIEDNTQGQRRPKVDFSALEKEWRELTPFAWADFERFLVGWATEHYKLNTYMKKQTSFALSKC
jgi:hypothetical protein